MSTPLPYSDDLECIPAEEDREIARIVEITRQLLAQKGEPQRDVHVKSHGTAVGEFHVLSGLPAELSQGLLSTPATYPAMVRFSNSAPQVQSDVLPDARGLAIKVQHVEGEFLPGAVAGEQDFVMANHPAFIAKDVKDYLRLEEARLHLAGRPASALHSVLTGGDWNPLRWHWRELLSVARVAIRPLANPASYTYFSMTPIRYGDFVAKYRTRSETPLPEFKLPPASGPRVDALRCALEETLTTQEVSLEFQIQLRTSVATMPIEDATRVWDERESPFITVARLVLPPQHIAAPQQRELGEQASFSVWHALAAHRPLGGINRSRKTVYEASNQWRQSRRPAGR